MKRNSSGMGTRYETPAAIAEKDANNAGRCGVFLRYICPICKKRKGFGSNHDKCSKILQQQYKKE